MFDFKVYTINKNRPFHIILMFVIHSPRGHLEDVYDMCWSTDGSRLISGSVDNSAIIWDINKGMMSICDMIKGNESDVGDICF